LLIHAVLEGLVAIDKDDGNFVGILAADFGIGIDIDFTPGKAAPLMQLDQTLLDDFAEMTSLPGINDDLAGPRHARQCNSFEQAFPRRSSASLWRKLPHK
jgi:hypothetical protein